MNAEELHELAKALLSNPIAYHPVLAHFFDSVNAAVFLSTLIQESSSADDDGWFQFQLEALRERTGLSRHEAESAFQKVQGFIEKKRAGLPARTFYRIRWEPLIRDLGEFAVRRKTANKFAEIRQTGTPIYTINNNNDNHDDIGDDAANLFAEFRQSEPRTVGKLTNVDQVKARVAEACAEFESSGGSGRSISGPQEELDALVEAMAEVCGVDRDANSPRLRNEIRLIRRSKKIQPTPELIRKHYGKGGWWYSHHWAGKRGSKPSITQIRETWGQWLSGTEERIPSFAEMSRADFTDAQWRRLNPRTRRSIIAQETGRDFREVEDDPNYGCEEVGCLQVEKEGGL